MLLHEESHQPSTIHSTLRTAPQYRYFLSRKKCISDLSIDVAIVEAGRLVDQRHFVPSVAAEQRGDTHGENFAQAVQGVKVTCIVSRALRKGI